jgi:hypothetical protein
MNAEAIYYNYKELAAAALAAAGSALSFRNSFILRGRVCN